MTLLRRSAALAAGALTIGITATLAAAFPGGGVAEAAPASPASPAASCGTLPASPAWYGGNRERLEEMLAEECGDRRGPRPVALFDWDNTVIRNDVGDATFFWMLRHDLVLQPAGRDWTTVSPWLTDDAADALDAACGDLARPGRALPTASDTDCADELRSVYSDAETTDGDDAFAGWNRRRTEPSYAFAAQVLAGHRPADVARFVADARAASLAAPIGATQRVGSTEVTGWVRYFAEQRALVGALDRAGFAVWIVTASAEPIVQVWARSVGIPPSRVIGVRTTVERGRLTSTLAGCGGDPEAITYVDGKRCAVNERVFGVDDGTQWLRQSPAERPAFGAGDSTTDLTFLQDSTRLRLVINRNRTELMCHAYDDADGRWLVNPQFIGPQPRRESPYPCASTGFTDALGVSAPVRREDGTVIPDQEDTVHPAAG